MKQTFYSTRTLRSVLLGAAISTATLTFTSCSDEAVEAETPLAEVQASQENGAVIPGKYIVVFKDGEHMRIRPGATYSERIQFVRELGQEVVRTNAISSANINRVFGKALFGVVADLSDAEVVRLRKDFRVAFVEPDRVVALAKPVRGGDTAPTGQTVPYGITRVGGSGDGTGRTAWIIDTGIDLDHPDLRVDATRGFTAFSTVRDGSPDDGNGHGTHVAGTIAALNNGYGVVGVAAGATVVPVKVLDSRGSGSYSGVIAGVEHVVANGKSGDVANMSLGGPVSDALDAAVLEAAGAGIKFVIAAGNDSRLASSYSPARVNHANVYTISAMDIRDRFASFSNYGNPPVDYCAPGVNISSTWKDGGYNTISGTSMASPHVAGILLLGAVRSVGTVSGDRDTTPDPIAQR